MNVGDVVGNYRITRVLGEGGMGVVYLGEHTLIGREAAIKVLLPSLSNKQDIVQRFFNEAKTTTSIKHPGIVEVYDFGYSDQGHAFIVMEHLVGETLDARIQRLGNMPAVEALPLLAQVARALGAAHELGIVHRDLKPENIYVVKDPEVSGGERTKILDFGIAKLRNAGNVGVRTASGQVMGPPGYMAPEQCLGAAEVDPRADIYALGCILFDMLCGRPPFESPNFADVLAAHVSKEPPPPSSVVSSIARVVDGLVGEMLQKAPEARPQSIPEVLKRIDAVMRQISGQDASPARKPKTSRPPPIPTAARKSKASRPPRPPPQAQPPMAPEMLDSRAPLPPLPQAQERKKKASLPPPVPRAAANARTMYEGQSETPAPAPVQPQPQPQPGMRPLPVPPNTTPGHGPVNPIGPTMAAPALSRPEPSPSQSPPVAPNPLGNTMALPADQAGALSREVMQQRSHQQAPTQQAPQQMRQEMQRTEPPASHPAQPQPQPGPQPPAGPQGTFALAPANQMEPLAPMRSEPPAVAFADPLQPMRPVQRREPEPQRANPAQFVDPRGPAPRPRAIAEPPVKSGGGLLLPFLLVLVVGGAAGGYFIYRNQTRDQGAAAGPDAAAVATNDKPAPDAAPAVKPAPDAAAVKPNPDAAAAPAADAGVGLATADAAAPAAPVDAAPAVTPTPDAAPSRPPTVAKSGQVIDPALAGKKIPTVTLKFTSRPSGASVTRKFDNLKLGKTPLEFVTKKFNANEEFVVELASHYPVEVKISTKRDGARQVLLLKKR